MLCYVMLCYVMLCYVRVGERVSLTQSLLGFGRGQVSPVSIDIFMSTKLLALRDQRVFQTFNLTFWFYFVIIITINVEMTGVLLGNIFSTSIFKKKEKMRSAWLLSKTRRNYPFEMKRTLLSFYTNQLIINILSPVFTF